jgi:hypothetical protein
MGNDLSKVVKTVCRRGNRVNPVAAVERTSVMSQKCQDRYGSASARPRKSARVRSADEDACDRCHAAPIILIAAKTIAAKAIMAMAADVPAPKPRPTMEMIRFIFYRSGERRIIAVAFYSRRMIRSFSLRCIRAVLCERTAEASARITCDR